jgi:hypothetical protein
MQARTLSRTRHDAIVGAATACLLLVVATNLAWASEGVWHDGLSWRGQQASVSVRLDGKYVLHAPVGERVIAAQRWRTQTASPLFDALFAMAQEDLSRDSVKDITDAAFDHGRPIPCGCFIAGKEWPFVWTRDVSYSIDLGLWRLDPARARASLLFKVSPPRAGPAPPRLVRDAGYGLGRQLADQLRPRGLVPRRQTFARRRRFRG